MSRVKSDKGMMSDQAPEGPGRWMRKREFLSYILLWRIFGGNVFNVGDAVDRLMGEMCIPRRTAFRILRRLEKKRVLERVGKTSLRCRDPLSVFEEWLEGYRLRRCRRGC